MENGQPILYSLYVYAPNRGAPIFFAIAYAASAVGHIWQCHHFKSWKLIGLHPLCAVLFTAGYALREVGAFHYLYTTTNLIIFVVSQVLIYVCPPLLELANYHVLGRILYYVPYFAPLPPGKILSIFGALCALVEALNALGVALASKRSATHNQQGLGSNITVAALALQLAVIVIFVVIAAIFHRRCLGAKIYTRAVLTPLTVLYVSMMLILIRCIYRLVEHLGNTTVQIDDLQALRSLSPIVRYEWFFYIFESTLMLINSVIWNVWNPGRYLPKDYHIYLAQDGSTEVTGEEDSDDRPLIAKTANVLTFGLLFRRKRQFLSSEMLDDYSTRNTQT